MPKRNVSAVATEPENESVLDAVKPSKVARFVSDGTYRNKQRVLVICSRGITSRYRHLMEDLKLLLPHHKKDVKLDSKATLHVINEIAEIKSCKSCIYLETRKRRDLYMWLSLTPNGPSAKFHLLNVHTMAELKLTGNCMAGSRPLLSFDKSFDQEPYLKLLKEMMTQVFGTPRGHPKSKPFIDRIMSFYYADGKIWVRNWQIADESENKKEAIAAAQKGEDATNLVEIGPRFVMDCIRVFDGSFGGQTLYQNPQYVSPNEVRRNIHVKHHQKYTARREAKAASDARKQVNVLPKDALADVFD